MDASKAPARTATALHLPSLVGDADRFVQLKPIVAAAHRTLKYDLVAIDLRDPLPILERLLEGGTTAFVVPITVECIGLRARETCRSTSASLPVRF